MNPLTVDHRSDATEPAGQCGGCGEGGQQPVVLTTPKSGECIRPQLSDVEVDGDAFAPAKTGWRLVNEGEWQTSRTGVRYRFLGYER